MGFRYIKDDGIILLKFPKLTYALKLIYKHIDYLSINNYVIIFVSNVYQMSYELFIRTPNVVSFGLIFNYYYYYHYPYEVFNRKTLFFVI